MSVLPENFEDFTVTISDARSFYGGCPTGWEQLCVNHNLSWKKVIREGLKASFILTLDDAMLNDLVKYKYNLLTGKIKGV